MNWAPSVNEYDPIGDVRRAGEMHAKETGVRTLPDAPRGNVRRALVLAAAGGDALARRILTESEGQ